MIFNPYYTTKPLDSRKGTGLGLSIAWSIISRHGGNIHVESEINQGTTVHVFLPVFGKNEIITQSNESKSPRTDLKRRKSSTSVLVMDDDALALDVIAQLLKHSGYETFVASSGEQAVGICKTLMAGDKQIDIALLDFEVNGGLNGFQTLEYLRKIDPHIMGILMTGHTDSAEINKYRQKGFSAMLEKPFSIIQLNTKINDMLMANYPSET
jgi:CheY-like chemotaxis protein